MTENNNDLLSGNNNRGIVIINIDQLEMLIRKLNAENQLNAPVKPDPDECITIKKVAKEFGVSASTVRNRINERLLVPKGYGGIVKLRRGDCYDLFCGDKTKIYQTNRRKSSGSK